MAITDLDSCLDCSGMNLVYRLMRQEGEVYYYEVTCRDCKTEWQDTVTGDELYD